MDCYKCSYYRKYDFNVNALYDMREDTANKTTEFYLSPYGSTCFQFTSGRDTGGGVVGTTIPRRYGTFCCFLFIQNSISASHSVSLWASSSSPFPIGFFLFLSPSYPQSQPIQKLLLPHCGLSLRSLRHSPRHLLLNQAIRLQQRRYGRRSGHLFHRPHFLLPPLVLAGLLDLLLEPLPTRARLHGRIRVYRRAARPPQSILRAQIAAHVAVRHGSLGAESDFRHADSELHGLGNALAVVLPRLLRADEENQRRNLAIVCLIGVW